MCITSGLVYICIASQITLDVMSFNCSHRIQSSPSVTLLLAISFHCFPLHLTLTFSWLIPCLHSHSSCQANKWLFAFPWSLMPRPGRETECWEGGKPVAWGYQKGRIDVCWLGPGRYTGWWNRWREVTSAVIKLWPSVPTAPKTSNPMATISTVLSMSCVWAGSCHSRHTADMPQTNRAVTFICSQSCEVFIGSTLKLWLLIICRARPYKDIPPLPVLILAN